MLLVSQPEQTQSLWFAESTLGWITVAGWTLGTSAAAFTSSSMIQALIILNKAGKFPTLHFQCLAKSLGILAGGSRTGNALYRNL